MTILLLIIIAIIGCASLVSPWVGVLAFYVLALLVPQAMWPWLFQDIRVSLYVSVATIVGTAISLSLNRIGVENFKHKQPWIMLLLIVLVNLSHTFTTVSVEGSRILLSILPGAILEVFNKTVLFYYISLLIIDNKKKFHYCILLLAFVTIMQVYWSNMVYINGEWWRFGDNGRLNGPGDGSADENYFAANIVAGLASIYFIAFAIKHKALKFAMYSLVPFVWHAVILTGSRAGFIAIVVATVFLAARSRSKIFGIITIVGLAATLIFQGGNMMARVNETVEQSENLNEGEQINPRIESWSVGAQIALDNPILGIGVGKFFYIMPLYSDSKPHVAHNTLIQFAAEAGLLAGAAYLALLLTCLFQGRRNGKLIQKYKLGRWHLAYNAIIVGSLLPMIVMSLFLDMMISEYFYFILMLFVVHDNLVRNEVAAAKLVGVPTEVDNLPPHRLAKHHKANIA